MKRFSKAEKWLIAISTNDYITYRCNEHGVYQLKKDSSDGKCIYCKKVNEPLGNLEELKEKFRKELSLD